jgi:hypothetical protein
MPVARIVIAVADDRQVQRRTPESRRSLQIRCLAVDDEASKSAAVHAAKDIMASA